MTQKKVSTPPSSPIKSIQFDLFSQFVANDKSDMSNTVEVWESIPKYFFTPKKVEQLRTDKGHADPFKWNYTYNGKSCSVKIFPALIEQSNGKYKAFFPGVTEELVEEALKKIFTNQRYGLHDPANTESWVKFTLKMIQKELKNRNRARDIKQIKHAIEVMSTCILAIYVDDKEIWKGAILQDLVTVGREEYLADTNAHHIARLPLFVSHSINRLDFRQFNYDRLMGCNEQLSRWIYKQLINRYKQASVVNDYHFMYSGLKDSGLLQQTRERDNRNKVKSSLEELVECGVLIRYEINERKEGRKVIDVKYTVIPSIEFIKEQKAANLRDTQKIQEAQKAGISPRPVDKLLINGG